MSVVLRKLLPPVVSPVKILCYPFFCVSSFFFCFIIYRGFWFIWNFILGVQNISKRRNIVFSIFAKFLGKKLSKEIIGVKKNKGNIIINFLILINGYFFTVFERLTVKEKLFLGFLMHIFIVDRRVLWLEEKQ